MNFVFSLSLPRVNSKFTIRFLISENIIITLNFSVIHHFQKLPVKEGFCALYLVCVIIEKDVFKSTRISSNLVCIRFRVYDILGSRPEQCPGH